MIFRTHPLAWLLRECRGRADSEDLIQEAFLKVERYRRKVGVEEFRRQVPLSNEEEYLRRTVRNLVSDQIRLESRRTREPVEKILERQSFTDPAPTPEDVTARWQQVERRLETVKKDVKEMYLYHVAGYSYPEIAREFGVCTRTVLRNVTAALEALGEE